MTSKLSTNNLGSWIEGQWTCSDWNNFGIHQSKSKISSQRDIISKAKAMLNTHVLTAQIDTSTV